MPTITISKKDMELLLDQKLPKSVAAMDDIFQYAGCEVESVEGDEIQLEIKCRNRPDLWCAEGIARDLKGALNIQKGLVKLVINKSPYEVNVDPDMKKARPFIACAVVRGVKLSDELIRQVMQQQDKIDGTYGRNRRKTSIGLYDADLISFPLYYTTVLPEGIKFVPLDFKVEMTPAEILEDHPKGKVYAHLVENMRRYPIFKDMTGKVLSFPPIINSNDLGKLTDKSTNLLVEVTGTNYEAVNNVLRIMTLSLAARGGDIHEVKINYPYRRAERTPRYSTETWSLPVELVNRKLGLNLTGREIASLLEKARHGVKRVWAGKVVVAVPAYRTDILHVVDLVEDVAVMYGYSNFKPQELELATVGSLTAQTKFSNKVCDLMVGFGAQEVQTFTLTDPNIFANTNCSDKHVELENPMTQSYSVLRPRLWPMLVNFLSKNTNKEYPQRVFEVGDVVIPNVDAETKSDTVRRLAFAFAGTGANFTYAKQVMITLLASLGKECSCREIDDDSFVAGRACGIYSGRDRVGVIGEIGPTVLEKVGIEMPVCVFEVSLGALAGNN